MTKLPPGFAAKPRKPPATASKPRKRAETPGVPPPQPEREFQRQVIRLAQLLGWKVAHFRTSLNARGEHQTAVGADGAGYPDLTLVGRGRVLWCELKTDRGHTSPAQDDWHAVLRANGAEVYVWRPRQWDELKGILEGGA